MRSPPDKRQIFKPSLRALAAALLCLVLWGARISNGSAQSIDLHPSDERTAFGLPLPTPPPGYETATRGHVRWVYPSRAKAEANDLMRQFPESFRTIANDLGGNLDDTSEVRIAVNPDDMKKLAPIGAPPPAYASGVTYPDAGLILLSLTAPESWERPIMPKLLAHELSHLALHRAVGGAPVPRWFTEGLAIYESHENTLERTKTLWESNLRGELLPLADLSRSFPNRPHAVSLAYAESASFVGYLRDGARRPRLQKLIVRLRQGTPFGEAMLDSYDMPMTDLEREWHRDISSRYTMWALALTTLPWLLMPILLIVAYFRRRHDKAIGMQRLADEDHAILRIEQMLDERMNTPHIPLPPPPTQEELDQQALAALEERLDSYLVPITGGGPSEPEVPTVEHEGENHILH